jgi:hypothetical protein
MSSFALLFSGYSSKPQLFQVIKGTLIDPNRIQTKQTIVKVLIFDNLQTPDLYTAEYYYQLIWNDNCGYIVTNCVAVPNF